MQAAIGIYGDRWKAEADKLNTIIKEELNIVVDRVQVPGLAGTNDLVQLFLDYPAWAAISGGLLEWLRGKLADEVWEALKSRFVAWYGKTPKAAEIVDLPQRITQLALSTQAKGGVVIISVTEGRIVDQGYVERDPSDKALDISVDDEGVEAAQQIIQFVISLKPPSKE